jgi:hypothetical protein
MPYIKQERRDKFDSWINNLVAAILFTAELNGGGVAGDLNYTITKLIKLVYDGRECYQNYNEIIGILECCKLEMYRRAISSYENKKIIENGDV